MDRAFSRAVELCAPSMPARIASEASAGAGSADDDLDEAEASLLPHAVHLPSNRREAAPG